MFKFLNPASQVNKNARNNCICLFIAIAVLMTLAMKDQRSCGGSYADTSRKNAVSRFMLKYMHPCDAPTAPRFKPPSEISNIVGYETAVSRRREAQAYAPAVRYYRVVRPAR